MERNQNLIRANKQPACNATKTDGTECHEAKALSLPDSHHLGNGDFRDTLTHTSRNPAKHPQDSHLHTQTTAPGPVVCKAGYSSESPGEFSNR